MGEGIRSSQQRGPLWLIELAGDFDHTDVNTLAETTAHALRSHEGPVAFDLSAVTFCDSSLLNHFLQVRRQRPVHLVGLPAQTRRVFEITGTLAAFSVFATVQDALDAAST
ncbi:STAS domain-containing protein [Streptomyces kunmingensis]